VVLLSWQRDIAERWDTLSATRLGFALRNRILLLLQQPGWSPTTPCAQHLGAEHHLHLAAPWSYLILPGLVNKAFCVLNHNHDFRNLFCGASQVTFRARKTLHPSSHKMKSQLRDPSPTFAIFHSSRS